MSPANPLSALRRSFERRFPPRAVNFWCHVTEGAFASFGFELTSAAVTFPVIAQALGASSTQFGLLSAIGGLSFLAPLFLARRVERARHKKRLVLLLGLGQRAPYLLVPALLLLLGRRAPTACLFSIAVVNLLAALAVSVLVPPWMDLLAETVDKTRVGRLFGYRNTFSSLMGVAAGPVSALIVASLAFPGNFAAVYLAALVAVSLSWAIFAMVDEIPEEAVETAQPSGLSYYLELAGRMWRDRPYLWFLAYQLVSRVGFLAVPFYTFVAKKYHGVSASFAMGWLITTTHVARIIGNIPLARLAERVGYKRVIQLGTVLQAAAALLAAWAPSGGWFVPVAFLSALGLTAKTVAGAPFMMTVSPTGRRIGYMSLSSLLVAPVGIVLASVAGAAIDRLGHGVVFTLAALLLVGSCAVLEQSRPQAAPGTAT